MSFNDAVERRTGLLAESQLTSQPACARIATDAVREIQQVVSAIRKEAQLMRTAPQPDTRARMSCLADQGRRATREARRQLQELASTKLLQTSADTLQQRKLAENLQTAAAALEESWREFDLAEKQAQWSAPSCADLEACAEPSSQPHHSSLQKHELLSDVSEAELETHAQSVSEYARDVASLNGDVQSLQRAMVDLAQITVEQGETLQGITDNFENSQEHSKKALEQVALSDEKQRAGNKRLMFLLLATVSCCSLVVATVAASH